MVVVIYINIHYIGYKYKAITWYLNGSPMVVTLGQQYNVGEKRTDVGNSTIELYRNRGLGKQ